MDAFAGVVLLLVIVALYFVPLIVAAARSMPNVGSIAVINVLLGWTGIGWIVALAMACGSNRRQPYPQQQWGQQWQQWQQQQPPAGQWPTDRPPGS